MSGTLFDMPGTIVVTEETVEAAAKAMYEMVYGARWDKTTEARKEDFRRSARTGLTAAAEIEARA